MTDISLRYLLFGEDRSASKTASKVGGAFSDLGNKIGGEVGDLLNRVGEGIDSISEHSKSVGKAMLAVGGVVAGVGVALQAVGSKDKAAMNALEVAIRNTGHSAHDYADDIEKAVRANENYGISAADTKQALATLTTATGSPTKALQNIGLAANLAAAQHVSLSEAASMLAKVLNGNGNKVLKQYGINLVSTKTAASALKTAENAHQRAVENVAKAQQHLNRLTEEDKGKKRLSTSAAYALKDASVNLDDAQKKLREATDNLTKAMASNKKAVDASNGAVTELGKKVQGRAAAQVDTFSGRIEVAKTKIGDWIAVMGQRFGPAIMFAGTALASLGTIYEARIVPVLARAIAAAAVWVATQVSSAAVAVWNTAVLVAQTAATFAQAAASTVATMAVGLWEAAQWALNAAFFANPIGMIILAIAAFVAVTILAYRRSATFRAIVQGAFTGVKIAGQAMWVVLKAAFHGIVSVAQWMWKILEPIFALLADAFHAAQAAASFVSNIAGSGGPSLKSLPKSPAQGHGSSPRFAAGVHGIITRPGMFTAGEAGAEAISITPLSAGRSSGGGGGDHYVADLRGAIIADDVHLARTLESAFQKLNQRTGRPAQFKALTA